MTVQMVTPNTEAAKDREILNLTADRDNLRFWIDFPLCERFSWLLSNASKIVCHETITLDQAKERTEYIRALTRIGSIDQFARDYKRADGKLCLKCMLAYGEANCYCCEECGHDHQSEGSCGAKPLSRRTERVRRKSGSHLSGVEGR